MTILPEDTQFAENQRLVLLTGPSGAGRATATRAFEDMGFETIDNLPITMWPRLLDGSKTARPLLLGIDVRNRDFEAEWVLAAVSDVVARPELDVQLLYLDCAEDVLLRRFSETRRRHPLHDAESPLEAIRQESDLLGPLRARADLLVDTTNFTVHDLRRELERWFAPEGGRYFNVQVQSFSYKRGLPRGLDMVFDVRFLRNPHWVEGLRGHTGQNVDVQNYVKEDPTYDRFFASVTDLLELLLPAYHAEGKSYLSIGFGCSGGKHRSVTLAEMLAASLAESGWQVSKRHRELERM